MSVLPTVTLKPLRVVIDWLFLEHTLSQQEQMYNEWLAASALAKQGVLTPARFRFGCLTFRLQRLHTQVDRQLRHRLLWLNSLLVVLGIYSFGGVLYYAHTGRPWLAFQSVLSILSPLVVIFWSKWGLDRVFARLRRNGKTSITVPKGAEYLLWLFLPREGREAAIGDTNETFEMMIERFGPRHAKVWYWGEVARSAWPLVSSLGKRFLKWTFLGSVAEWMRRHI